MDEVSSKANQDVVIIGAGIAGLTAGYYLSRRGKLITVIEKQSTVGGLARSFDYGNGYIFDVGPHRFHTDDEEVAEFIEAVLGENLRVIPRKSGVYFVDRYHDWPLKISTMFKLPLSMIMRIGRDLLLKKGTSEAGNFEEYILAKYGKTLYETFFKIYTSKFLLHPPATIHSDWAKVGIDRAVIDKKLRLNTLFDVVKQTILPLPVTSDFLYPDYGGIEAFSRNITQKIISRKGQISLNDEVEEIKLSGAKIVEIRCKSGLVLKPGILIWTAPITILLDLLGMEKSDLKYLSMILFNVEATGKPKENYMWCYYGQKEVVFSRVSTPICFSPHNAPSGKVGVCLEVTTMEGSSLWNNPQSLIDQVIEDMVKVGLIKSKDMVHNVFVEKIPNVYPIYEMDYYRRLDSVLENLAPISNLILLGRTGTFWYNNMDHSIRVGMNCGKDIVGELVYGRDNFYE